MRMHPARTGRWVLMGVALLAVSAHGQDKRTGGALPAGAAPQPDWSKIQIVTTKIRNNFYALESDRGTRVRLGVLTGPDGILVVDSAFAPLSGKVLAAIHQISDGQIRFLINTHVHPDHIGGNDAFAKAGALIMARPEVRDTMLTPGGPFSASSPAALPGLTYIGRQTIRFDGETVELISLPAAHTNGDTLVHFVVADVIMPGDIIRTVGYPNIGGTVNGMIDALGIAISMAGPEARVVQGHGPMTDRAGLVAQRDMLVVVRDRVAHMIGQGKSVDEVLAARPTAEFDQAMLKDEPLWYGDGEAAYKTPERFIRQVYADQKKSVSK